MQQKQRTGLFLFLFALVLRMIYLREMSNAPYFVSPQLDELSFHLWAQRIAFEDFWGSTVLTRGPIYPYFLGILYKIIGPDFFLPRAIQAIVSALSVVLLYRIGLRTFGKSTAITAGILAAVCPTWIFFDGEIAITSFGIFTHLLMLLLFLRWLDDPSNLKSLIIAGLASGLASLTRPNILLVMPFFAFWSGFCCYQHAEKEKLKRALLAMTVLTLAVLIPILPVTLRNYIVAKDIVLISDQGGINFQVGNNPHANGWQSGTPKRFKNWGPYEHSVDIYARLQAEEDLGRSLKSSEISRYWNKKTWQQIQQDPTRWLLLLGKKGILFWNAEEIKNNKYIPFVARFSNLLNILLFLLPFGLIAPLALAAMCSTRPTKGQALLLGYLKFYMLSVILFFVYARYRMPIVPILILYAAHALVSLMQNCRGKKIKQITAFILLFIASGFFVNFDWYGIQKKMQSLIHEEYWIAGNGYRMSGRYDEALDYYQQALELKPDYADAWLNLGQTHYLNKDLNAAKQAFLKLLQIRPDDLAGVSNLALIAQQQGDEKQAEELWRTTLTQQPDYAPALLGLGDMLIDQGRLDEAQPMLEREFALRPNYPDSALALGRIYHLRGDRKNAFLWFQKAEKIDPAKTRRKMEEWGMISKPGAEN